MCNPLTGNVFQSVHFSYFKTQRAKYHWNITRMLNNNGALWKKYLRIHALSKWWEISVLTLIFIHFKTYTLTRGSLLGESNICQVIGQYLPWRVHLRKNLSIRFKVHYTWTNQVAASQVSRVSKLTNLRIEQGLSATSPFYYKESHISFLFWKLSSSLPNLSCLTQKLIQICNSTANWLL